MTTLSLPGLASEIARVHEARRDFRANTNRLSLTETESIVEGELVPDGGLDAVIDLSEGATAFGVTRHAHQQIAEHLDVPFKTYDRLCGKHPDLLAHLANGLFVREPSKRLVRVLDGNVRAFLSDRYRVRDNYDLMDHLLPILSEYSDVQFKECSLTETRMYVKTYLPDFQRQVTPQVGDIVRGGVIVSNSEVGSGSLYIYPYTDRLICKNGMVHTSYGQRRVHIGKRAADGGDEAYEFFSDETLRLDDAAFFAKCADTLRACLNESVFDAIVGQMRDLAAIQVPGSPLEAVEELSKKQGFNEAEKESCLRHLIEGGDLSAWGFVNGVTAMARDLEDADRRTSLEMLAGRMTAEPAAYLKVAA